MKEEGILYPASSAPRRWLSDPRGPAPYLPNAS